MKQTFILEIDSDTHPAILTAKVRQELGLFVGKGAYTLHNASGYPLSDDSGKTWTEAHSRVQQYLGCDPKVARSLVQETTTAGKGADSSAPIARDDLHRVEL